MGRLRLSSVAKADPDGYTLLTAALPVMAIVPAINKVRYDPLKDFAPISNITTNAFVLVVDRDLPINTLSEFIAYVRARPGQLSYASAGIGSLNHLSMALFLKRAGLEMTHVPYREMLRRFRTSSPVTYPQCFPTCPTLSHKRQAAMSACLLSRRRSAHRYIRYSDGCRERLSGIRRAYMERTDGAGPHPAPNRR